MNEKMFDALEICLQALDNGETVDAALKRFPALADELRPILEASLHAKSMAGEAVAEDIHRRGRAKVLQRAAEMRESKRAPRKRTWVFAFRPIAITLMLVVFLLSGTNLVRASSTALPGDNLYSVKRTWEDFTLIFKSGMAREDLELTYETERVEEIQELLAEGRGEVVTFSGYVNTQTPSQWTVAGVPVLITADTVLPAESIVPGSGVTVSGTTNGLGFLVAQNVEVVPAGTVIPDLDDDEDSGEEEDDENENSGLQNPPANGDSADSSSDDADESGEESMNPETKLKGVLEATKGKLWVVNGQNVDVSHAEIVGTPAAGAAVTIEGFYDANGIFVATKVVFSSAGGGDGSDNSDGGNNLSNDNDDNDNDDDENDNDDNDNSDDDNNNNDNNNNDGGDNDNGDDD